MADINDIKSKAIKGSVWSFVEKFSLQIVQFVIGTILARLLEPKDYGLIALTTIFTGISTAIIDGGFEKALIQRQVLSRIEISTAFYLNIILGILITLLLVAIAPSLSSFFNEPGLTPILQVVAIGLFIESLGQVQRTLLIKELNFKRITYAQITSSVAGGIAGIILAYSGMGVWSLAYSGLIAQIIRVLFYWVRSDWYPRLEFSLSSIKTVIPYGVNVLFTSILFFIIQQFNNFIVGKFYNKEQLGLFNRGSKLPELALGILQSVVVKMSFPLFAKFQEETSQLQKALKKTIRLAGFVAIPLLTLLYVNAEDLTILLFTEKWRGSIIFLECFCVIKFFEPFIAVQRELILAKGKANYLLKLFIITSVVEILLIVILLRFGILYIVLATFISRTIQYFVYNAAVSRMIGLSWYRQTTWIIPFLAIAAVMFALVKPIDYLLPEGSSTISSTSKILCKTIIGLSAYYILCLKLKIDEIDMVKQVFNMVTRKIKSSTNITTQLPQPDSPQNKPYVN